MTTPLFGPLETPAAPEGPYGEPIEPPEAIENQGEFPVLNDQGEKQATPRTPRKRPAKGRAGA